MKILITESQQKALDELQWLEKVTGHMTERRFPMTSKIYQLISGKQRVKVFHISDVHKINELAALIGTKKTISAFTYVSPSTVNDLHGIQTKGGVLYEIYGDLVIHSPSDIMSRPDENGIRWIDSYELLSANGNKEWNGIVKEFYENNNINNFELDFPPKGKERTDIIKKYFIAAEKFISGHVDEIKKYMIDRSHYISSWNEVLVNNIEIHDVFWSTRYADSLYQNLLSRELVISRTSHLVARKLSPREKEIVNDYPGWIDRIQKKLESISSGTVIKSTGPEMKPMNFVLDRGGYVDKDQYKNQNFVNQNP